MTLELSREETEELARVLDQYLGEFHDEIARTDRRDLRGRLQASYGVLQEIKGKLDAMVVHAPPRT